MTATLLVLGPAWLLLAACGWVVTGLLPDPLRTALRPAAPVVGLAVPVLVLHWTGLLVGVDVGVWALAAVLLALAALATRRDRRWWAASRTTLLALVGLAAVAVLPATVLLAPSRAVGDSAVVQPNNSNDAFFYVTVTDWLRANPVTDVPHTASHPTPTDDPPSYFAARSQLTQDLRVGQELTQAAVGVVLHRPSVDIWYPLTALWLLLLPAGGWAVAGLLRLRPLVGVGFGLAVSVASLSVNQLATQNSDSLLGTLVVPVAVAAVVAAVGRARWVPPWLAGVLLTTAVGTYTEYLPLIGPALVVAVLARRPGDLLRALRTAVLLLVLAVAVSPLVWVRAVHALLFLGGIQGDAAPSAFLGHGAGDFLNRFLGTSTLDAPFLPSTATAVLGVALAVGVLAAVVLSRRRSALLVLAATGPALAWYLVYGATLPRPYTQQRTVQLMLPLVLLVAVYGWDELITAAGRWRAGRPARLPRRVPGAPLQWATAVAAVGLLGVWGVANRRSDLQLHLATASTARHVDPTFATAAGWVRALGGRQGADVDVLAADFFSQLWLTDALRGDDSVAYPRLYVSYQGQQSYWTGSLRRYLLVDTSARVAHDPGMVVRSNARFQLLDLRRGRAAVLTPADEFGTGNWFVLRTGGVTGTLRLHGFTVVGPVGRAPIPLQTGVPLPAGAVTPATATLTLPATAPGGTVYRLTQGQAQFQPEEISLAPDPA